MDVITKTINGFGITNTHKLKNGHTIILGVTPCCGAYKYVTAIVYDMNANEGWQHGHYFDPWTGTPNEVEARAIKDFTERVNRGY